LKYFIKKNITARPLWFNILVALLLIIVIGLIFTFSLDLITKHGVARTVPSIVGQPLDKVVESLEDKGFEVVIQDSVFYDSLQPTIVVKQIPEPDAVVKVNRTIYVTYNRVVPPDVDMPNLVGYSLRNAEMILKNQGLVLGDTVLRPDFAKNSVLEQLFNGQKIAPGDKIKYGSRISLVIGSGVSAEAMSVPKLLGLTYEEAKMLMSAQGLILGSVIADPLVQDTAAAFVYRQNPPAKDPQGRRFQIRPGQMMDVWLSRDKPNIDSLEGRTPPTTPTTTTQPEQDN
jgi:eukaryotic-like serine/threonine-protein kinase